MSAGLAQELAEVKAEIAETKAKITVAENAGRTEAYLTKLTGILEQLYTKENRLAGNIICKESFAFSHFIVLS